MKNQQYLWDIEYKSIIATAQNKKSDLNRRK